jgi:hypothetical protein
MRSIYRQDAKKGEKNRTDLDKQNTVEHFFVLNPRFSIFEEVKVFLGGLGILVVKKSFGVYIG